MKRHILFVDDEPKVLGGLRRMLCGEQGEWDMSFAGSADDALAMMRESGFDVVVSDVNMPGKDGFALLEHMRGSDDTKDIQSKMDALQTASYKLGEVVYERAKAQQTPPEGEGAPGKGQGKDGDEVVDADFEVKE